MKNTTGAVLTFGTRSNSGVRNYNVLSTSSGITPIGATMQAPSARPALVATGKRTNDYFIIILLVLAFILLAREG
jgi:hypothetical protein